VVMFAISKTPIELSHVLRAPYVQGSNFTWRSIT